MMGTCKDCQYLTVPVEFSPLPPSVLDGIESLLPFQRRPSENDSFGVCVAPIRGDLYSDTLLTFIDHYSLLSNGNAFFMIYNDSAGNETSSSLHTVVKNGNAEVIQWSLKVPAYPEYFTVFHRDVWSNAQLLAIHDCLFRVMGRMEWAVIVDLDEFIVGRCRNSTTFTDMFNVLNPEQFTVGFIFLNAFFDTRCSSQSEVKNYPLDSTAYRDEWWVPPNRSKMVVDPISVYVQYVHFTRVFIDSYSHLLKGIPSHFPAKGKLHSMVVPPTVAGLHHYRFVPQEHRYKINCENSSLIWDKVAFFEEDLVS